MPKRFCVDNDSGDASVRKALIDLHRTVKMGKLAERALTALRETGCCDRRVPVISRTQNGYEVWTRRFPAYVPISRDSVPNWDNLAVECGERTEGKYAGKTFHEVPVFLSGTALMMELSSDDGGYTGKVIRVRMKAPRNMARLGSCRLRSNGEVTFVANSTYGGSASVFRIKRNPDASDRTKEEAQIFARIVACCLINFAKDVGRFSGPRHPGRQYWKIPQEMIDLLEAVPVWLAEDGHIKRMFNDMLDAVEIVKVMHS
jgi:hypothetical protein